MRHLTRSGLAAAGLVLTAGLAVAQPQVPGGGGSRAPTVSPYLNLANRGGTFNPGITYLGIVRPQQQFQQQQNQFQQQLTQTNQNVSSSIGQLSDNLFTGRGATFGYYSHYYYNSPTGGGGRGGGTTTGGFGSGGGIGNLFRPGGNSGGMIGQAPRPNLNTNQPRR